MITTLEEAEAKFPIGTPLAWTYKPHQQIGVVKGYAMFQGYPELTCEHHGRPCNSVVAWTPTERIEGVSDEYGPFVRREDGVIEGECPGCSMNVSEDCQKCPWDRGGYCQRIEMFDGVKSEIEARKAAANEEAPKRAAHRPPSIPGKPRKSLFKARCTPEEKVLLTVYWAELKSKTEQAAKKLQHCKDCWMPRELRSRSLIPPMMSQSN